MDAQPRIGVGAFIQDPQQRLLLVRRRRMPEAEHWGLPGGKVDFGETLQAAVTREIAEELGVEIVIDELLCLVGVLTAARARPLGRV